MDIEKKVIEHETKIGKIETRLDSLDGSLKKYGKDIKDDVHEIKTMFEEYKTHVSSQFKDLFDKNVATQKEISKNISPTTAIIITALCSLLTGIIAVTVTIIVKGG